MNFFSTMAAAGVIAVVGVFGGADEARAQACSAGNNLSTTYVSATVGNRLDERFGLELAYLISEISDLNEHQRGSLSKGTLKDLTEEVVVTLKGKSLPPKPMTPSYNVENSYPTRYADYEPSLREFTDCAAKTIIAAQSGAVWKDEPDKSPESVVALCNESLESFSVDMGMDAVDVNETELIVWKTFHDEIVRINGARKKG